VNPGVEPGLRLSGALWVEFAADCIGKVRKGLAIAIPSVLIGAAVSLAPEFVHPSPEASQALPSMDVIPSCYTYAGLLEDADLEPHEAKLPAEQKRPAISYGAVHFSNFRSFYKLPITPFTSSLIPGPIVVVRVMLLINVPFI